MSILLVGGFYLAFVSSLFDRSLASPLRTDDFGGSNSVPAFPVQPQSPTCKLDLSEELFGGVNEACGRDLDRSRCCPVLAAWLLAAHARSALQLPESPSPGDMPMMPDDSQKCVNALQSSLRNRSIRIPQPNATCDPVLCFCGIRLHQLATLRCPAAFNITAAHRNATPSAALRDLEPNCRNSSYAGCTKCLLALEKIKGKSENGRAHDEENGSGSGERRRKMLDRDCQLMGLTWLLEKNKTAYIATVSAVLRAVMYSAQPPEPEVYKCSPDQENMPLAVDSLQFEKSSSTTTTTTPGTNVMFPMLPLIVLVSLYSWKGRPVW